MKPIRGHFCSILFAALALSACAQIVVEEEVHTDSVDVFAYREPDKSPGLAMAASVLLPGLGHQYLGNPRRAAAFFATEAALWFGFAYCERYARKLIGDSRAFAWRYAGAQGGTGADDYYWQMVGLFMDDDEFNRVVELNREEDMAEKKYLARNLDWHWATDSLRVEYTEILVDATRFRTASSFVVAALVINRVVAFIDARVTSKYRGIRSASTGLHARPVVTSSYSGLTLTKQF